MDDYKVSFTATTDDDPSALLDATIEVAGKLEDYLSDCLVDENTVCVALLLDDAAEVDDDAAGERSVSIKATLTNKFLWGVFITALEGGIGYWSRCSEYKPYKAGTSEEDYDDFRAVISVPDDVCPLIAQHRINADVIHKGIERLLSREVVINDQLYSWLFTGVTSDSGMIDADVADCVVQAGLFEEVRYG